MLLGLITHGQPQCLYFTHARSHCNKDAKIDKSFPIEHREAYSRVTAILLQRLYTWRPPAELHI